MAATRYPNLKLHMSQHATFEEQIARLEARLAREGVNNALIVETSTMVSSWLRLHIASTDQVFGRFLAHRESHAPAAEQAPASASPPVAEPDESASPSAPPQRAGDDEPIPSQPHDTRRN